MYVCARAGARACVCARRKCIDEDDILAMWKGSGYIDEKTLDDSFNLCKYLRNSRYIANERILGR